MKAIKIKRYCFFWSICVILEWKLKPLGASYTCGPGPYTCGPEPEQSTCGTHQFTCDNARCTALNYVCDNDDDCKDGSDERDCAERPPCIFSNLEIQNAAYSFCGDNRKHPSGYSISFSCYDGYVALNDSEIVCLDRGQWSENPGCVATCPSNISIPNARILIDTNGTYFLGDKIVYECNDDFVVTTNYERRHSKITCSPDWKWLPDDAGCAPRQKSNTIVIHVQRYSTVSVPCVENEDDMFNNITFRWLKNSNDLENSLTDYSVHENGTLTISKIEENAIGHYVCFSEDLNTTTSAIVSYLLQPLSWDCSSVSTETHNSTLNQGTSAILKCPHKPSDELQWFKNGHHIRNVDMILPDGSLYIQQLELSHQAFYTCKISNKQSLCPRHYSTYLRVEVSAISVCGKTDNEYSHPWIATIWQKDEPIPVCYGTLIHNSWVVTAAHCMTCFNKTKTFDLTRIYVQFYHQTRPNMTIKNNWKETADSFTRVKSIAIHPQFTKRLYAYDIALVQLITPVHISNSLKPICLSDQDLTKSFKQIMPCSIFKAEVVGWGSLRDVIHKFLLNESMTIVNLNECDSRDSVPDSHFCTKKTTNTITTLAGDSGSPLEFKWNGRVYLHGIYSWGTRLNLQGNSDYFTRLTHSGITQWIQSMVPELKKNLHNEIEM